MSDIPRGTAVLGSISFDLDPELHCESRVVEAALAAWSEAKGERAMPSRQDIDPLRLPSWLLPHILLIDIEREPRLRFRWRLIGTYITDVLGRDSTGQYWDELYDEKILAAMLTGPTWVLQHRRPLRTQGAAPVSNKEFLFSENVELPLSSDGENVDVILVASDYG